MPISPAKCLSPEVQGWLRFLWRKTHTEEEDDWSSGGEPHPWWDRYSVAPMLSFPRFDLSESSYALLLMARRTPAWREAYVAILDKLIDRHLTHWAAVDWLTQIGPDPDRANYPSAYRRLIPKDLWGQYDVPGWTANGVEPWGLQEDPIGSDGNLFFRGFLTLMLGIHRAISGDDTWDRPFEMTGYGDHQFEWTHSGIVDFLHRQWRDVPHGPHCENTKVWPYCLSAAGLGLQISDLTLGKSSHQIVEQWIEDFLQQKYLHFDRRGNLRRVALYYDPLLERTHDGPRIFGLAPAFYLLPQHRQLAEVLYRNAVSSVGWDRWYLPVFNPGGEPRMLTIALLLAREFGDLRTERRVQKKLAGFANGRYFDADAVLESGLDRDQTPTAASNEEFGFFFEYDEPWPRGQESALLILRDLLESEGDWHRAFNEWSPEELAAPRLTGIDYPHLGIAAAYNDEERGTLEVETYAATRASRDSMTRFSVEGLPKSTDLRVERNGEECRDWAVVDETTIEVRTTTCEQTYRFHTGYRGAQALETQRGAQDSTTASERPAESNRVQQFGGRLRPAELLSLSTAPSMGCPCCAG